MRVELDHCSARHIAARADAAPAMRAVSLRVAAGEQVAVIGPSGAGKTTLLHTMGCALAPSAGGLQLGDAKPWSLPAPQLRALRGALFLAPQVPPLPPRQRVVTSVLAGRLPSMGLLTSLRNLFYPMDISAAHDALAQFGLEEKLFERVDRLSGGERQRVGLARALVSPARLLLVDEPLSALDPTRASQAIATLTRAATQRGATLIASLHQVETALANFPRVIGMRDGEVAFDVPTADVSKDMLARLYAHKEHELTSAGAQAGDDLVPITTAQPAVMHCR
jgi:phosphonate transport system ATP-binding protein